jgi:hypothetical protein
MANLARAYAASGKEDQAIEILNDLKIRSARGHLYAAELAVIYTALGDNNQAMFWAGRFLRPSRRLAMWSDVRNVRKKCVSASE